MSADPTYPAFSVFAFISFVLVLIPLPWHLQAWNSGTCLYMIWVAIACLNTFINSIIWRDHVIDLAPLFCDISTRITVGVSVAIPAASLCINRRLYKIASCSNVTTTIKDKRRIVMVDLAIGLGIPFVQMALQFVVQGHRYDIWEGVGCYPTTVNTPMAYPLSFLWPNIISLVSATYCILTLREFMRRRAQFSQLMTSNASLSINRYFRLMCLATAELIFNIPISTYGLYLNITSAPIYPWRGWSDLHFGWYVINTYPAVLWRSNRLVVVTLELSRWSLVLCALVFFGFFGFADEARKHYRIAYWTVLKRLGITPPTQTPSGGKISASPIYRKGLFRPTISKPTPNPPSFQFTSPTQNSTRSLSDRSSFTKDDYAETLYHSSTSQSEYKLDMPLTPLSPSSTSTYTLKEIDSFNNTKDSPV